VKDSCHKEIKEKMENAHEEEGNDIMSMSCEYVMEAPQC